MTTLLAFQVAVPGTAEVPLGSYDPEQQEFIWEGDSTVTLGWPGCSTNFASNHANCTTTSTQCYFSGNTSAGWIGYICDYYY